MAEVEPGGDDTEVEAVLRAEVRLWMDAHAASFGRSDGSARHSDTPESVEACRAWQRTLDEGGWGAVTWPVEFGGRGFGPNQARIFREEQQRYAVSTMAQHTSVAMVGPTIIAHGTPDQQERLIGPIRRGEALYCQLFSEPDAGSDLASLRTKAVRDGDQWIVTGQKIWTSGAHHADRAILLARTDPDSSRHAGITYFLVDMHQPGIDVRPIVQINGGRHFNEVYLDEVRVDDADRLGPLGEGWKVARTTLGAERAMIGAIRVDDRVDRLIAASQAAGTNHDPVLRQELAEAHIRATVLALTSDRVLGALRHGGSIGPEASVLKLSLSTLFGRLGDLAMRVLGPEGLLSGADDQDPYGPLQDTFLAQWAPRIGGGTEQIQRNLISELALGLPRDPDHEPPADQGTDMTQSRYPFPLPIGWFAVARLDELDESAPYAFRAVERDLVAWNDGTDWHVFDAYCPHLGAHFGVGGRVEDGCLVCPFHEWTFDGAGSNVAIPYADRPNRKARVLSYPAQVRNRHLIFWYHPDPAVGPLWEIPDAVADDAVECMRFTRQIKTVWQELAENAVDLAHFVSVHGMSKMGEMGSIDIDGPLRVVRSKQSFQTSKGEFEGAIESSSYGPGIGVVKFELMSTVTLISASKPLENGLIEIRQTLYHDAGDDLGAKIGTAFGAEVDRQFGQDIPIWENKRYQPSPALAPMERPVTEFRRWAKQFYVEPADAAESGVAIG